MAGTETDKGTTLHTRSVSALGATGTMETVVIPSKTGATGRRDVTPPGKRSQPHDNKRWNQSFAPALGTAVGKHLDLGETQVASITRAVCSQRLT